MDRILTDEDCFFLENVMIDIRAFIEFLNISSDKKKALLFPPVSNYRRFLVHKLVEETFHNDNLATISIGKLYGRRTVVFPAFLRHMEENASLRQANNIATEVIDDAKRKPHPVPIYRPPAARKRENIAKSNTKTRKPDKQIYVPRARRSTNSSLEEYVEPVHDEKSTGEVIDTSATQDNDDDIQFLGIVRHDDKDNTVQDKTKQEHKSNKDEFSSRIPSESCINFQSKNTKKPKDDIKAEKQEKPIAEIPVSSTKDDLSNQSIASVDDNIIEISSTGSSDSSNFADDTKTILDEKTDATQSSPRKSLDVDSCDWEELFDESGEYVDESLINELMTAIGNVSVQKAAQDYRQYQTAEERSSDGECIIEVYGFPSEFRTEDLFNVFTAYRTDRGFQIVWVDDTHALAVFSSPIIADEVLNTQLPFVKTRPLKNAIAKSKSKASNFVLPPVTRPKTCVSLARRLVSGHLGMKINVTAKQREAEKKLLSDAREQKRLQAKQKVDAWEGSYDEKL